MKPKVYLSGPITGVPRLAALGWRKRAAYLLHPHVTVLDPFRGRESAHAPEIDSAGCPLLPYIATDKALFDRDYHDVLAADVLLINMLSATQVSQGTNWEMAWAYHLNKPMVACITLPNPHDHLFFWQGVSYTAPDLETGCRIVRNILNI